nr:DNA packaging terminase subunit 1 [Monodontid alphaherpesvirus 2]
MFGSALGGQSDRYFQRLLRDRRERVGARRPSLEAAAADDDARVPFLNFATSVPRRHQTVFPAVGTVHNCCASAPLFTAAASRLLFKSLDPEFPNRALAADAFLSERVTDALRDVGFRAHDDADVVPYRNAYYSTMNALDALRDSDAFAQVALFVRRFRRLVDSAFASVHGPGGPGAAKRARVEAPAYGRAHGTLELFQKMLLMHATYFVAAALLGDHAERAGEFLKLVFNTPEFSDRVVQHFRQRATVFLVPRRHGKTWFLVPLIALALATFKGIRIGYTAHIRKATEPVFEEVGARLHRWFGAQRVEHIKGEIIAFTFPDGARSTVVFASSHNTNGIRGQDFNLLFVDEANFIRPDAVQTIVGFLNQANCKIIFVSSTNTGKTSTSFLRNLKNSSDELLNIVTYICDDHMDRVSAHTNATACSCYVLSKPVFITMDAATRATAETFLPNSFMQEIIGGGDAAAPGDAAAVFTRAAGEQFLLYRPSTSAPRGASADELFVYVDPAFTSNARASGTGVAVVGKHRDAWVIFGLEHFFLPALTGGSSDEIGACVTNCLAHVLAVHRARFAAVYVAVEGNSSQDSAVAIALGVRRGLGSLARAAVVPMPASVLFYHSTPPGGAVAYPFFLLQKQKTAAFDRFIRLFNSGNVLASQDLVSLTIRPQTDPVEYLYDQLQNLTERSCGPGGTRVFSGKRGGAADDLMVALVMAVYLGDSPVARGAFAGLPINE